jgi:hypothetical protein
MEQDLAANILDLAYGHVVAQALAVAASLNIAEYLREGGLSLQDLAQRAGVPPSPLGRVLGLLASRGVFAESEGPVFANTPLSNTLTGDNSVRDAVVLAGHPIFWDPVGGLADAVRTARPSFDAIFGRGFFDHLAADPEARDVFNAGMHRTSVAENVAIARRYPFNRFASVLDVGGGRGGFLLEILRAHANLVGVLFDSPEVVEEGCVLTGQIDAARYQTVAGNFFQAVPVTGDAVLLKRVLHDWDDRQCVGILKNCAQAMRPGSTLVVFEAILQPGADPAGKKVSDVLLMTLLPGRERTIEDFRRIFREAGFALNEVLPMDSGVFAIEGSPVGDGPAR